MSTVAAAATAGKQRRNGLHVERVDQEFEHRTLFACLEIEIDHLLHHQHAHNHPDRGSRQHDVTDRIGEKQRDIVAGSSDRRSVITAIGSAPMMPAEAFASCDIAWIFAFIFLRSRSTFDRLPSASERLPPDLLLNCNDDSEKICLRQRRALVQFAAGLAQRHADRLRFHDQTEFSLDAAPAPRTRSF